MLVYVRYNEAKFQYDLTNQYFRASVTPGRTFRFRFRFSGDPQFQFARFFF